MANWWEEGAFRRPGVSTPVGERPAAGQQVTASASSHQARHVDWRSIVILMSVAVLVVAVRGLDRWRGHETISQAQRVELQQVIAAEITADRHDDLEAYIALLDPNTPAAWREKQIAAVNQLPGPSASEEPPTIERWEFQSDAAMVDLRFPGPPAMRETRFYRVVDGEWRRTPPIASFWGGERDAEGPGVRFVYRELDADVVQEAIQALRTAYRQGGVSGLAGAPLTVEIAPEFLVEYDAQENRLILPSPRLTSRRASIPPSVLILWQMAHPIADRLADPGDALRYRYLDNVQLFQDHLRYWTLRWQAPFPQPWQVQMLDTLRAAMDDGSFTVPRAIDLFSANRTQAYLAYFESMTVADYVVERFGAGKLIPLDEALSQTHSWDRAIPAALGLDIVEFERGWKRYLHTRLGIPPATVPSSTRDETDITS